MTCKLQHHDFENVRDQLRIVAHVYERAEARAQAIGFDEDAHATARRRHLVGEIMDWLDAREELGETVRQSENGAAVLHSLEAAL